MPIPSDGHAHAATNSSTTTNTFTHLSPGAPTTGLQSFASLVFRQKRYVAYISGSQLSILTSPTALIQTIVFEDEELVGLAADAESGKLLVASDKDVHVLEAATEGWTKVWWEKALVLVKSQEGDETRTLSWGGDGDVLVGGTRALSLFSTLPTSRVGSAAVSVYSTERAEERKALWSQRLASPVAYAVFSPSADLIASCTTHDRLVKVWRRLSFEEGLFDYTYLPHPSPATVTHLEWRPLDIHAEERRGSGIGGRHEDDPEVLYTFASDGLLRIWRTAGMHDVDIMSQHTILNLITSIPTSPTLSANAPLTPSQHTRYACLLPADPFCVAVAASCNAAVGLHNDRPLSNSLEHLKQIASQHPDVVITLDGHGRMSAWGLQSIGHKRRPDTPSGASKQAFHIAHAEDLELRIGKGENARFGAWCEEGTLHVLVHTFGREGAMSALRWWRGEVEDFFSPSISGAARLREVASWSGHGQPITGLCASSSREGLLSWGAESPGEVVRWRNDSKLEERGSPRLRCERAGSSEGRVMDAMPFGPRSSGQVIIEDHALTLEAEGDSGSGTLWLVVRGPNGDLRHDLTKSVGGAGEREWRFYGSLQSTDSDGRESVGVFLSPETGRGLYTTVRWRDGEVESSEPVPFELPRSEEKDTSLFSTLAIIPMRGQDLIFRFRVVAATRAGTLQLFDLHFNNERGRCDVVQADRHHTGIQDADVIAGNHDFAALSSNSSGQLAVADLKDGYVESIQCREHDIRFLEFAPVPKGSSNLLAVGYETSIDIFVQSRVGLQDSKPNWVLLTRVQLPGIGLTVGAIAWTSECRLAVGAGNGVYLPKNEITLSQLSDEVQGAVSCRLEGKEKASLAMIAQEMAKPLPVWHPTQLSYLIAEGRWCPCWRILESLAYQMKFWSEGETLDPLLGLDYDQLSGQKPGIDARMETATVEDVFQQLDEKQLPAIGQGEQSELRSVVQGIAYCSEHVGALDQCALRFLFTWKLQTLRLESAHQPKKAPTDQPNGHHPRPTAPEMHWREIAFAYHSTTQRPLLDLLLHHHDNKLTWPVARALGLHAWLTPEALAPVFEALAQSAYRATHPADPINASLYFLALHKKPTLVALWRIATWHKEQRGTMSFLKRDFAEQANVTAAKKNAYALMGKRRFEYAAAFFLLAGDAASATSLLAGQCGDVELAVAVARLFCGDGSPMLRGVVETRIWPEVGERGDGRWRASWCAAVLGEAGKGAEALVQPWGEDVVRRWGMGDPSAVALYGLLRKHDSMHVFGALLRAARTLRRMGLWWQALALVSQWDFRHPLSSASSQQEESAPVNGVQTDSSNQTSMLDSFASPAQPEPTQPAPQEAPSMLDSFASPPAQDDKLAREAKAAELLKKLQAKKTQKPVPPSGGRDGNDGDEKKKREPTQFTEPSANSLLNSFGL